MKLTICDDEKRIRELIEEAVREVSESIEIEGFADAKGILSPSFDADILFLDIEMAGIDGMKAARLLRAEEKKTVLVFVTALEEYVFQAFDVGAFQYLVKPFDRNKLREVIKKAIEQAEEQSYIEKVLSQRETETGITRSMIVKSGGTNTRVILSEIVYAEIFDRRIVLHMADRDHVEYYGRISNLESLAGKDFFRVHRAFLLNLAYVKSYDSKYVQVSDAELPVARGRYRELVKAYLSYHTRRENL